MTVGSHCENDASVGAISPSESVRDDDDNNFKSAMEAAVHRLQDDITSAIARVDGGTFREDSWSRPEGGLGTSRVLQDGSLFEKAGVGVSIVHGVLPPAAQRSMMARLSSDIQVGVAPLKFYACGLSLVMHPHNPHAPTVHMNIRMFQVHGVDAATGAPRVMRWFGGGADLTPSLLYPEDARHFHAQFKSACDATDGAFYPRFKSWCDDYFTLEHRGEKRGVGGIFFDDLTPATAGGSHSESDLLSFVLRVGDTFLPAYLPLLARRAHTPFTPAEKQWQALRRGRYVEFNLIYDRGTKFGLATPGARIESIMMSLPLHARWEYMHPLSGTPTATTRVVDPVALQAQHADGAGERAVQLMQVLRAPVDWLA